MYFIEWHTKRPRNYRIKKILQHNQPNAIKINSLDSSTVNTLRYTFCIRYRHQQMKKPFHCKIYKANN